MNEKTFNMLNELAEKAGFPAIKDKYSEVRASIQESYIRQYAVLGNVNCGKSTVINILAEEKRLPVTVRASEHDKVAYVESEKHNCRWVELAPEAYVNDKIEDVDSPLWHMDGAIYILSATAPFSQQDVTAIKECAAHGVPCSLVLSKLDAVDEAERDEVIAYVRAQEERFFGSDTVITINVKDEEATRQVILNKFDSTEDVADIRDYLLTVSYAKTLKEHIAAKFESARKKIQVVAEQEKKTKQALLDENIKWDKINLDIQSREVKLIEAVSAEMNRLYSDCITALTNKAMLAKSPKEWWEQSLEKEFRKEIVGISNKIDKMICSQVADDRDWLVKTVEKQFGTKLSIDTDNTEPQFESVVFGVAPEGLIRTGKGRAVAMTSLVISSIALCGVLAYPVVAMHSVNSLYWRLAGVAVAGTGFWTHFETKKEKEEKLQYLKSEIARYIHASRDENIEVLKKNINYGYESMCISVQDLQLAAMKAPVNEKDGKAFAEFKALSDMNGKCDEIVNSLISKAE